MFLFTREEVSFRTRNRYFRFRWFDAEDGRTFRLWWAWGTL